MTSLDKPTDHPEDEVGQPAASDASGSTDAGSADVRAVTEAALFEAFGGARGMVETVLPGLLFVAIYTVDKNLHVSAIAALAVSLLLVVVRLYPPPHPTNHPPPSRRPVTHAAIFTACRRGGDGSATRATSSSCGSTRTATAATPARRC